MSDFIKWTLEAIREEGSLMSWMEERRTEWTPLLASKLKFLLEGRAFILITDSERGWFEEYFLKNINKPTNARPVLPFFSLKALYPSFENIGSKEEIFKRLKTKLDQDFQKGKIDKACFAQANETKLNKIMSIQIDKAEIAKFKSEL